MNPEIKAEWVARLRSGNYLQGQCHLVYINFEDSGWFEKHCCLGVLCEIAVEAGIVEKEDNKFFWKDENGSRYSDGEILPISVREWAGLGMYSCNPEVSAKIEDWDIKTVHLSELNDSYDFNFEQIADLIETQL